MINDIFGYLDFIDVSSFDYSYKENYDELMFSNVVFYDITKPIPSHGCCDIAIIGVPEGRNSKGKNVAKSPMQIRKQLYSLYSPGKINIVDFGNIKQGKSVKDTYVALREVLFELLKTELEVIIIGGSKDLLVPICDTYKAGDKLFNLCVVEPRFNFSDNSGIYTEETYLSEIIESNNKFFNYTNLGYQTYYNSSSSINYVKNNFEAKRLGTSRSNMIDNEPYIRDADIFAIDLCSIKQTDAPDVISPSIHGYYGEEMCKLASYSGFSDRVSTFGVFNLDAKNENNKTAELAAQIIWHFIQAYNGRRGEYPDSEIVKMKKIIVSLDNLDEKIVFYKSESTGRWWVELTYKVKKKSKKRLISCTENDYQIAINNEIPLRWWKFYKKFNS